MKTIKVKEWKDVPQSYTGIVEFENGDKGWYKKSKRHREDGPAYITKDGTKFWHLDGYYIWFSYRKLNSTNQIILSKTQHPEYPLVQVWKILNKDGVYERIIIPGMEEFIKE